MLKNISSMIPEILMVFRGPAAPILEAVYH
jgi:hypothetical protein